MPIQLKDLMKLFIIIFLPLTILAGGIEFMLYSSVVKSEKELKKMNEILILRNLNHIINKNFNTIISDLIFISKNQALQEFLDKENKIGPIIKDLLAFSHSKRLYEQIRFMDNKGMEVVRINFNRGKPKVVPKTDLQSKAQRYYFDKTMNLNKEEVFVSPFDLNMEHGEIEKPLMPIIRFGTPVFDRQGKKRGIILLNFTGNNLLKDFENISVPSFGEVMFLNSDGYWLKSPNDEDEWGFMIDGRKNKKFSNIYPDVWKITFKMLHGQLHTSKGMFTFLNVYPLLDCIACRQSEISSNSIAIDDEDQFTSKKYYWKIVSRIKPKELAFQSRDYLNKLNIVNIVLFVLFVPVSLLISRTIILKKMSEEKLRKYRENLEEIVKKRTFKLRKEILQRKSLEVEQNRLITAIEQADETIMIADINGTLQYVNPSFERVTGYKKEEVIGKNLRIIQSGKHDKAFYKKLWNTITQGNVWYGHFINKKKDGTLFHEQATITPIYDKFGKIINYVGVKRDITREVMLEKQINKRQKLEAIGTLASGIAHDFNNILTHIIGCTELAIGDLPSGSSVHDCLKGALKSANHATDLVKQILTFSRQTEQERKPLQLHLIVKETLKLLRSVLPATIEIRQSINVNSDIILADPTQMHQIIINLCSNAEHAMREKGGILEVTLKEIVVDAEFAATRPRLMPMSYLRLSISDTGCGMDKATMNKIFDPFYTTKDTNEGTGLGLAIVHGIVKNHDGTITVYSEPDKGTIFNVYLPTLENHITETKSYDARIAHRGNEKILFIDDEEELVKIGKQMLERLGYTVISETSSIKALKAFKVDPYKFDLVITDQIMPKMKGIELANKILQIRPDIPIILYAGFSNEITSREAQSVGICEVLMKPLASLELGEKIRGVLDKKIKKREL